MLRHRPLLPTSLCSAGDCEDTGHSPQRQYTVAQLSSHPSPANNAQRGVQPQVRGTGPWLDISFVLIIARRFSSITPEMISGVIKTVGEKRNNGLDGHREGQKGLK